MIGKCDNCRHDVDDHSYGNMGVLNPYCNKCKCKNYKNKITHPDRDRKPFYEDFF